MVLVKPWAHGQPVPDGWAERHRPIVAGFFCDTAVVRRKTGRTDSGDGLGTQVDAWTNLTPVGGVRALMQVKHQQRAGERDSAGNPIVVANYYCRLDVEWLPATGDRIIITASPDPANLGTYVVRERESQGHVVDRTLHCERVSADTD